MTSSLFALERAPWVVGRRLLLLCVGFLSHIVPADKLSKCTWHLSSSDPESEGSGYKSQLCLSLAIQPQASGLSLCTSVLSWVKPSRASVFLTGCHDQQVKYHTSAVGVGAIWRLLFHLIHLARTCYLDPISFWVVRASSCSQKSFPGPGPAAVGWCCQLQE